MSAGSTPGWDYDVARGIVCEGENLVAIVHDSVSDMAGEDIDRRGRLIAAAPDMLAALRELVAEYDDGSDREGGTYNMVTRARAAIAKATESPGASNLKG